MDSGTFHLDPSSGESYSILKSADKHPWDCDRKACPNVVDLLFCETPFPAFGNKLQSPTQRMERPERPDRKSAAPAWGIASCLHHHPESELHPESWQNRLLFQAFSHRNDSHHARLRVPHRFDPRERRIPFQRSARGGSKP